MDTQRWKTAGLLALMIGAILLLSGFFWVLPAVTLFFSVMAVFELLSAARGDISKWAVLLCFALAVAISLLPMPRYCQFLTAMFPTACGWFLWIMNHTEAAGLRRTVPLLLLSAVICLFARSMGVLRNLENGFWYLLMGMLLCVISDSAGYFCGKRFGKRKIAPRISPNKTVAGTVGGVAFVMLCAGGLMFLPGVNRLRLLGWAVPGTLTAQFGDLALSAVKRSFGVKDFGTMLPGHGGLLDRFDSDLFVLPFTVLYVSLTGGFLP